MPFKRILVPTDFGEPSRQATDLAAELARKDGASLVLLHTCELPAYTYPGMAMGMVDLLGSIEAVARKQLDGEVARVRALWPDTTALLKTGYPWQEILAAIDGAEADLVVMGTHGRHGLSHVLLGSVAEKIVRSSKVPVLTLRGVEAAKAA